MSNAEFKARRDKLLTQIGEKNAAILFSSEEFVRNGDVHFPFQQNSEFYYFTGFLEPESVAVFLPGRKEGEFVLFNRSRDPAIERWTGARAGQEGACKIVGADQSYDIEKINETMIELLSERKTLYYELGKQGKWDQQIMKWVSRLQDFNRKSLPCPTQLYDISVITHELRLFKSPSEIELLKKACEISAAAHTSLMEICKPDIYEYELEAKFDYEIHLQGARFNAYPTIAGGGANACVLHYVENKDKLKAGDLVLVDAGGEYQHYAADITRTYPVNGKFSEPQALIYDLVLDAQLAVIQTIKPGLPWNRLQKVAVEVLTQGLLELGILKGTLKSALEKNSYQEYYMHNIGHWLGLDVHDAGSYKKNGHWRELQCGMVLTVEPGLYLSRSEKLDKKWWDIGIRIEDDVLVTEDGCEVLSDGVPKKRTEIESLMAR